MDKWATTLTVVVPGLFAVVTLLLGNNFVLRRWRAEREDKLWAEALALARVIENPDEAELAKAIARTRLEVLGITDDWLTQATRKREGFAAVAFPEAVMKREDTEVVRQALVRQSSTDPDIQRVIQAVWKVEAAFERARSSGGAEEDTRIRIFLVLVLFASIFVFLSGSAVVRALL